MERDLNVRRQGRVSGERHAPIHPGHAFGPGVDLAETPPALHRRTVILPMTVWRRLDAVLELKQTTKLPD